MWVCWDSPTDPETLTVARKMADDIAVEETQKAIKPTPIDGLWRFAFEQSYEIDEAIERQDEKRRLSKALLTLRPREERIIRLRCGMGCDERTYEEIGDQLNLTKERIRQIEFRALQKLENVARRSRRAIASRQFRGPPIPWKPSKPTISYSADVNGKIVPITIKKWIVGDERHLKVMGMPGPYFVFDHEGIEMVGAKQELIIERRG